MDRDKLKVYQAKNKHQNKYFKTSLIYSNIA